MRSIITMTRLLLLALVLFCATGATYYVDNLKGNDSWDGLKGTQVSSEHGPWQHLSMINRSKFDPGDRILFKRGGAWQEKLVIPSSGLPHHPITIGAYGTGKLPVIDGGLTRGTLYCAQSWVVIQDLELKHSAEAGLHIQAERGSDLSHVTIQRVSSHGADKDGIVVINGDNKAPAQKHPITNIIIKECRSYDNGYHGIVLNNDVSQCIIAHNQVYHNGLNPVPKWGWHGISLYGENSDNRPNHCIIEYNEVYDQQEGVHSSNKEGAGIQCDDHSSNIIVRFNNCHNNLGAGIVLNVADHIMIYYNILAKNGNHNEYGDGGLSIGNSRNVKLYNNVFYDNDSYGICIFSDVKRPGPTSDITLVNNIIYSDLKNPSMLALRIGTNSGGVFPNFVSHHNCWFYHSLGRPMIAWLEIVPKTFAQYQRISRQDQSPYSFEADPLFIDPARGDFRLRDKSPCLGRGANVGLSTDFEGKPLPVGSAPSLGVYAMGR
jgi:Right handed beta helix region